MESLRITILLSLVCYCSCLSVDILKPTTTKGPEAALVIVPGAHIEGSAYRPLAEAIQKRSGFKLWIALLKGFFNKLANPIQLPLAFNKAMKELKTEGYNRTKVFIAGHSIGGVTTAVYGQNPSHLLEGVMLFSAYLTTGNLLKEYPFPVLTLSGDLDGLTRTTRIVDTFVELENDVKANPDQKYTTPVIVMEGVNHGQFASGTLPATVTDYDLNPEVSNAAAYDKIANYSNAFMMYTRNSTGSNLTAAESLLDEGYTNTSVILKPLAEIKSIDQNADWVSHWTNTAQQLKVSLKNTSSVEFINYEDESFKANEGAVGSTPSSDLQIVSMTTIWLTPNPEDSTTSPLSPLQLKATMKSQEAIKQVLPARPYGLPATCKDINEQAFTLAFSRSSPKAKSRFTSRGRPIKFVDDINVTTEFKWLFSKLDLNYNKTGLFVTATRYHSGVSQPFNSGQDDCTLLSPFRAMEWIYIDSLKNTTPSTVTNVT